MTTLFTAPVTAITSLTSERAVEVVRALLRAECQHAKLTPSALTLSSRLTVADGGIDAEIICDPECSIPADCFFRSGLTGVQIKSGASFTPWTEGAIRDELVNSKGQLPPEVTRLIERRGRYTLISTGHDLTPKQRNDAKQQIAQTLSALGCTDYSDLVEVIGASQLVEFIERYPGVASLVVSDPIAEGWVLDEWRRDTHMTNTFEVSDEQATQIEHIRAGVMGEAKHIRILGEPGLGKTRIVLEAVSTPSIAASVLYFPHGSQFGQSKLFRRLLQATHNTPLVLVIDELPESELSQIWRHLKARCGALKLISLDHGRDETYDEEIDRIQTPRLSDSTIKKILVGRVGESREIDRWVEICEGSPRVAQAVAENLRANPDDLLKPPATVPIWARFLHSYGKRDEATARQIDCVTQHLALFNRFGYESPVAAEAKYVADLVSKVDPTIGWARFQEIVRDLRARRVLQGSKTLFFVPRALHIYLWQKYWSNYGNGFDFKAIFAVMPESLHAWFMGMFRYAGDAVARNVVTEIVSVDGVYADRSMLASAKGSAFLSTLAEANPGAVLRLLEATLGTWSDAELLAFGEHRQNIVWALGKIAVWSPLTARAIGLLVRLAVCENAKFSNNATGTVIGLFRIGPEKAVTEASPQTRLPALLNLLRASNDEEKRLGLKAMSAALDTRGMGFRIVGPEYQGLKERAALWVPKTYSEWWDALHEYFIAFFSDTKNWPPHLLPELRESLLEAVNQQIAVPPCTGLAFDVLESLINSKEMSAASLNNFFWNWQEHRDGEQHKDIVSRLRTMQRRYFSQSLAHKFQRYVIDVEYAEWDEGFRDRHNKPRNRAKQVVRAIATRISRCPEKLDEVRHLLAPSGSAPALWYFAEQLAKNDVNRAFLPKLIQLASETKHQVCLHGYLSQVQRESHGDYVDTLNDLLSSGDTAWLGATIAMRSDYDDAIFGCCLTAYEHEWISCTLFGSLRYGKSWQAVPSPRIGQLIDRLLLKGDREAIQVVIELFDELPFDEKSPFTSETVFSVVAATIPGEDGWHGRRGYDWKNVCEKLLKWEQKHALPLLQAILAKMEETYRLSYDHYVEPLASEIVRINPLGAWQIVKSKLEVSLPKARYDILHWLKGGLTSFDESTPKGAVADLPLDDVLKWIEVDAESRAGVIALAAPRTLDDDSGGRLTRELLQRYATYKHVRSNISSTFHSGGWSGPASEHYKKQREKFRTWLASGFAPEINQWIESELEYLDRRIESELIDEERSRF